MKTRISTFLLILFIFISTSALIGCGGGSSGTGVPDSFVGKVLTGSVLDENSAPVSGADIKVVETGEETKTDNNGNFTLSTAAQGDISLTVGVGGVSSTLPISSDDASRSQLKITVNRRTGLAHVSDLSVTAKIVGRCDFAFENNATIRQSNKLSSGTPCPLRVKARGGGRGISGIPFRLDHKMCDAKAPWKVVLEGLTSLTGVGQETFSFSTNSDYCDYRIVVAHGVKGVSEVVFPISTFQRQAEDAAGATK